MQISGVRSLDSISTIMIRARIRLLGLYLIAIKSLNNVIRNFSDVYQPCHHDNAIEAVKMVAGYETKIHYDLPAVASHLGTLLKHVGEILRSQYVKEERAHDQRRVESFLLLQVQNNRRRKVILPSLSDITKLHDFFKSECDILFKSLEQKFNEVSWRKLAEVCLISLQIFNRLRAGEIERVYLEDFVAHQGIDQVADKDTFAELSNQVQALAKKYVRFMIRGKLGKGVPVLVPFYILDALRLIQARREEAGIPETNPCKSSFGFGEFYGACRENS